MKRQKGQPTTAVLRNWLANAQGNRTKSQLRKAAKRYRQPLSNDRANINGRTKNEKPSPPTTQQNFDGT